MEKVFFEYGDVKVTNTRFINGANTYTMAGITSIKLREKKPSMTDVVICVFFVLVFFYQALGNYKYLFLAAPLAVLAYYLYINKKSLYFIILATSGGETEGLVSDQLEYTEQVVNALNEAVIFRA